MTDKVQINNKLSKLQINIIESNNKSEVLAKFKSIQAHLFE